MYISPIGCFFIGIGVGVLGSIVALIIVAFSVRNKKEKK